MSEARPGVMVRWWVGTAALLVPVGDRARFVEEWLGELTHLARTGSRRRLWRVAMGVVADALTMRRLSVEPGARGERGLAMMRHELGNVLRALSRAPGYSLFIVLTLGLGIGANGAMFGVIDRALLRPLPFTDGNRLVRVWEYRPAQGRDRNVASYPDFVDWRERNTVFSGMAAHNGAALSLATADGVIRAAAARVTGDFFDVMAMEAAIGRMIVPSDDAPGAAPVIVLSDALWRSAFGGKADVVGQTIRVDGVPHTVVGVARAGVTFPFRVEAWIPLALDVANQSRGSHSFWVVARLADGVTIERASDEMVRIAARLESEYPQVNEGHTTSVYPLQDEEVGDRRAMLVVLFVSLGLVLLLVCVNVASLQLARTERRRHELALRSVLGATRARLAGLLVMESFLLALAGGMLGAAVAWMVLTAASPVMAQSLPWLAGAGIDGSVLLYIMATTGLAVVLTGVVPAWRLSRIESSLALREDRRGTSTRAARRLRSSLVIAEFAIALLLLVGAGLTGRTLVALLSVDPGFDADRVLTAQIWLSDVAYASDDVRRDIMESIVADVGALPGVESAGITYMLPMSGMDAGRNFRIEGQPVPERIDDFGARFRIATGGYFRAMGIPLRRGRTFEVRDGPDQPLVAVINESMAREFWPGDDPIGARILLGTTSIGIIGIVGDVSHAEPGEPPRPEFYLNLAQRPVDFGTVVVRTDGPPVALAGAVRAAIERVDPAIPVTRVEPMTVRTHDAVGESRILAGLVSAFALVALLLATSGIYGVMSYSVSQRNREIGVRLAVGGQPRGVRTMVLRDGLRLVAVAIPLGLIGALALARTMGHVLFGVAPTDPLTLIAAAAILSLVAGAATLVPAIRATRVDPMSVLRD